MSEVNKKLQENKESLEILANAKCSSSYIAKILLQEIEGDISYDTQESYEKPNKRDTIESEGTQEPDSPEESDSGIKEGIFAY